MGAIEAGCLVGPTKLCGRTRGSATSASPIRAAIAQSHDATLPIWPAAVGPTSFTACLTQSSACRPRQHCRLPRLQAHCYRPGSSCHRHPPCRPRRPRPPPCVHRLDCPAAPTACAAASSSTMAVRGSTAAPSPYGTSPHGTTLADPLSSRPACAVWCVTTGSFAARVTRSCSTVRRRYRSREMRSLAEASAWARTSTLRAPALAQSGRRRRRPCQPGELPRPHRPARLRHLDWPCAVPAAVWSSTRAQRGATAGRCPCGTSRCGITLAAHLSKHLRAAAPYATAGSRAARATPATWQTTILRIRSQGSR